MESKWSPNAVEMGHDGVWLRTGDWEVETSPRAPSQALGAGRHCLFQLLEKKSGRLRKPFLS